MTENSELIKTLQKQRVDLVFEMRKIDERITSVNSELKTTQRRSVYDDLENQRKKLVFDKNNIVKKLTEVKTELRSVDLDHNKRMIDVMEDCYFVLLDILHEIQNKSGAGTQSRDVNSGWIDD